MRRKFRVLPRFLICILHLSPHIGPFFLGIFAGYTSRNFSAVKCKVRDARSAAWNKACLCSHFETFIRAEILPSCLDSGLARSLLFSPGSHNLLYEHAARTNCISRDGLLEFFRNFSLDICTTNPFRKPRAIPGLELRREHGWIRGGFRACIFKPSVSIQAFRSWFRCNEFLLQLLFNPLRKFPVPRIQRD